jgi:soluble lytic murein transglycosylase-like protein
MSRTFLTNHHRRRAVAMSAAAATALAVTVALGAAAAASPDQAPARGQASRAAGHTVASSQASGRLMAAFNAAARESGVPDSLLLAIGYSESRWEARGSMPSAGGGYGLMNLTTRSFTAASAAGKAGRPSRRVSLQRTHYTLDEAARLLHVPASTLKTNQAENIRGAAAVLASYARAQNGGRLPSTLGGWYGAVAAYSGATTSQSAGLFAGQVFGALRSGAALTTSGGQAMRLPARPGLRPDTGQLARVGLKAAAAQPSVPTDCPSALNCDFVPAAYAPDSTTDPTDYGDYDIASRPQDLKIFSIVIHDTEESYADTINTFTNRRPSSAPTTSSDPLTAT